VLELVAGIREKLDSMGNELGVHDHVVRYRRTGYREIIEGPPTVSA